MKTIEHIAMAIVNHVNETVGTSVDKRQATNDELFDYTQAKIFELLNTPGYCNWEYDNIDEKWDRK